MKTCLFSNRSVEIVRSAKLRRLKGFKTEVHHKAFMSSGFNEVINGTVGSQAVLNRFRLPW